VADAVERARRSRPGTDGRSARENCIGALRALFARAERAGLVAKSPAADLEKPRRLPNRRRALEDDELREVIDAVRTTSQDPDLDLLLIRFHLESGARREGALNLSLRDLDGRRITRRRYNTVFDRARPCLPWAERTSVSAHILRHTAITAVERHAGFAVAQAFAGHSATSVTGTYTRARLGEVAAAVAALTGEAHPLAEQ
jgi:integrase